MAFNFWAFWKKNGQHITAITVFIFLMFVGYYLYIDINLKKAISENCGWGEDDYYCYCEKSEAMEIKNKIDSLVTSNYKGIPNDGFNFSHP